MRIAILTETFLPNVNGVVTTLQKLLDHIDRNGHDALLFAPEGSPATYGRARIVPLAGVPLPLYPELRLTPPQIGFSEQLRRFQPDLLHLAGVATLGATGRYLAARFQIPMIAAYHTDFPAYTAHYRLGFLRDAAYAYLRWVHNGSTLTLCPSSSTLADLRSRGFRRLRMWGRGVDTLRFNPQTRSAAMRSRLGAHGDQTLILYVGRLASEKRLDLLADALAGLDNVHLALVGDGPERPALQKRLSGRPVTFAGYLHGDDLAAAYASADMFVMPSDTETFGQVIQEAMASGLPVVAAGAGGALDLVRDGVTGLHFAPGKPADLREKLADLVSQADRRRAMGRAGRLAAEQRSWTRVMDELFEYYNRALRRSKTIQLRTRRITA